MVAYLEHVRTEATDKTHASGVSFRDVLFALRRHRWLILGCGLVGSTIGVVVLLSMSPSYTAESSIVLETRRPNVIDLPALVAQQTTNPETAQLRSEVEVLQSDDIASRVILKLGLNRRPDFQKPPSMLTTWEGEARAVLAARFSWLLQWFPSLAHGPASEPQNLGSGIAAYHNNMTVANDGRSYIIHVQYHSHDRQLAARIVNTHVQVYLDDQVAYKQAIGKQASAWLTRELSNLQAKLRTSEEAVQQFREDNQLVQTGDTTLLAKQLAAVNAQIPIAEAESASAESRLNRARDLLLHGRLDTQPNVIDSPLIQRLREEEAGVLRRQAELRATYGDKHPTVKESDANLHDLRATIKVEVNRILDGIENDVHVAKMKEGELRRRLVELERRSVAADRAEGKLRDLQREVSANSSLIEVLLNRYKQVSAQEEIQQPDARVVSMATAPLDPSFPKLSAQVPMIVAVSVLFGMVLSFLKELTRRGFKGSREVEAECELPSLGSMPMVPRAWPRIAAPHDLIIDHPHSAFAEAIRYIRNSMQASAPTIDTTPQTVLITSSLPNEGKSVLALSLARSFARAGKRTLIIDADLRNPSVRKMIGGGAPGVDLAKVLGGEVRWQDAVSLDTKSTVEVIGGTFPEIARHDLVASSAMRDIIEQCRRQYDVVIVDSPPITAVSDAMSLSRWVDATMLVVRWGATPREIAKTSLNTLFHNGARVCGVVLAQVDMQRGVFSPAEFEYYHKQNRSYYAH